MGEMNKQEEVLLTLTFDDEELECVALGLFVMDEQEYIAVEPVDESIDDVYIFRFSEDENGESVLENIEDDDEFEKAAETFNKIMEEK